MLMVGIVAGTSAQFIKMGGPRRMPAADSADAAAALKSFMTANGGNGMFYQYRTQYNFHSKGKDSSMVDTMSTSISENHFMQVDMGVIGTKMSLIGRTGLPKYSVTLYPQTRKYKLNIIDTARLNSSDGQTYRVTKVGTEMVAGYPCIQAKLTIIGQNNKTIVTEDIWTSTAVPGYMQVKEDMSNQHVTVKMMRELENAGCDGFIVKVSMEGPQMKFDMLLVTAVRKSFPSSMFVIPAGYTKL
jgi:hypothetical protein